MQKPFSSFDYIQSGFGRRDIDALLYLKDRIIANQGSVGSPAGGCHGTIAIMIEVAK